MRNNRIFWEENIGEEWTKALSPILRSPYGNKLIDFLGEQYRNKVVFPPKEDLFKAFKLTPLPQVRVVVVGFEPYMSGLANGLAYGNNLKGLIFDHELNAIFGRIEEDFYDGLTFDFDWTLESWAKQGVFLLNTSLSVQKNKPNSHVKPWKKFTLEVLEVLNKQEPIIFMLWGKHGDRVAKLIAPHHTVLKSTIPYKEFWFKAEWKCSNFLEANVELKKLNNEEIKW